LFLWDQRRFHQEEVQGDATNSPGGYAQPT
jgi:hypothetical protein